MLNKQIERAVTEKLTALDEAYRRGRMTSAEFRAGRDAVLAWADAVAKWLIV